MNEKPKKREYPTVRRERFGSPFITATPGAVFHRTAGRSSCCRCQIRLLRRTPLLFPVTWLCLSVCPEGKIVHAPPLSFVPLPSIMHPLQCDHLPYHAPSLYPAPPEKVTGRPYLNHGTRATFIFSPPAQDIQTVPKIPDTTQKTKNERNTIV